MNYKTAFGLEVAPRKKKLRLIAISSELISLLEEGATYEQLTQYVKRKEGFSVSADWLEKTIRAVTKKG